MNRRKPIPTNASAKCVEALKALYDPTPVSDLERARHVKLVREQRIRDEALRADLFDPEPPKAA